MHHVRLPRPNFARARRLAVLLATVLVTAVLGAPVLAPAHAVLRDPVIEGRYDVGGHELYLSCRGSGSPTVLYLHGAIFDSGVVPHRNALAIRDHLDDHHRVCLYDRRNVGRSDTVDAIQQPKDMVRDLENLLEAAEIEPPYVLLGASFGGTFGHTYAAEHPEDVVGMVMLDSMVPEMLDIERFWPIKDELFQRFHRDDMFYTLERISHWKMLKHGHRHLGDEPRVPLTYVLAGQDPWDQSGHAEWDARIMGVIEKHVSRWSPGTIVTLDTPHFMEVVVPEEIAGLVLDVIDRSDQG